MSTRQYIEGAIGSVTLKHLAQFLVIISCATAVKLYYSTASVDQLRWILAPTTFAVELLTGSRFEFESHAGYMSSDHSFLIAASCAGVNFLITAFLMLSLRTLCRGRAKTIDWRLIPTTALFAYLATLVANTVRISIALLLRKMSFEVSLLNPNQLHRFEGIFIYFGFLLLLFVIGERVSERYSSENLSGSARRPGMFRGSLFPLLVYYVITLGIPLANGASREGTDFREHALFVLVIPLVLLLPIVILLRRTWRAL
ncbi:MAG: exosortase K [bacterium]